MDHKSRYELTIITSGDTDSVGGSTSTDFALVSTWEELIDVTPLKSGSARAPVAGCGPSLISKWMSFVAESLLVVSCTFDHVHAYPSTGLMTAVVLNVGSFVLRLGGPNRESLNTERQAKPRSAGLIYTQLAFSVMVTKIKTTLLLHRLAV